MKDFSGKTVEASKIALIGAFGCSMLSTPFQILLYVSFFLFLAGILLNVKNARLTAGKRDIALAVFLASCLITVIFSGYKVSALSGCGVFLIYLLVYFFLKNIRLDGKFLDKTVTAVAVSLTVVCGFALVHYLVIRQDISIPLPWGGTLQLIPSLVFAPGRPIMSILQHPMLGGNMIAILATFLASALVFSFRKISTGRKIFLSVALAIALVTMTLTYSRGAFLYVGVALIALALFTKRFRILIVLLAVTLVFLFLPNEKLHQTLRDPLSSPNIQGRMLQYQASLEIFSRSNWVTGIGLLNFRHYYLDGYAGNPDFERFANGEILTNNMVRLGPLSERIIDNMPIRYVHNVYLSLLAETGIVGFLSFFAFIVMSFAVSWKSYFRNRDLPSLQALVLIPGFLANSLFDNLLYTVPAGILIWVLIGLSQNRSLASEPKEEIKEKGLLL